MRKPLFFVTSAALLMATSPALAGPCPATRAEGQKIITGLTKLGSAHCSYPCSDAIKYNAPAGLTIFGVQPLAVVEQRERASGLSSVIFILPGPLSKFTGAFRKTFAGGNCNNYGGSCETSMRPAEGGLRQVVLNAAAEPNQTRLMCNFVFMD